MESLIGVMQFAIWIIVSCMIALVFLYIHLMKGRSQNPYSSNKYNYKDDDIKSKEENEEPIQHL